MITVMIKDVFNLVRPIVFSFQSASIFLLRCKKNIILDKKRKRRHKEKGTDNKEWEQFINQKLLEVWRRPVDSSGLYEYKGIIKKSRLM